MKKRIIIGLFMAFLPIIVFAQIVGGQVSRPVKKTEASKDPLTKIHTGQQRDMSEGQRKTIIQNLINNMVYVEGGSFMMGATQEQGGGVLDYTSQPVHYVTLSSFYIGKYEIRQEEWVAVMGYNPSKFKGLKFPVDRVSMNDCLFFISKINKLTGKKFRLPTEAEWEYAARGGNRSKGYRYAGSNNVNDVAWYEKNSNQPHEVGQLAPNELGLYDMSGNVAEWCGDWYGTYDSTSQTNPTGPKSGNGYVLRGSSWFTFEDEAQVSARRCESQNSRCSYNGFRIVMIDEK